MKGFFAKIWRKVKGVKSEAPQQPDPSDVNAILSAIQQQKGRYLKQVEIAGCMASSYLVKSMNAYITNGEGGENKNRKLKTMHCLGVAEKFNLLPEVRNVGGIYENVATGLFYFKPSNHR